MACLPKLEGTDFTQLERQNSLGLKKLKFSQLFNTFFLR